MTVHVAASAWFLHELTLTIFSKNFSIASKMTFLYKFKLIHRSWIEQVFSQRPFPLVSYFCCSRATKNQIPEERPNLYKLRWPTGVTATHCKTNTFLIKPFFLCAIVLVFHTNISLLLRNWPPPWKSASSV